MVVFYLSFLFRVTEIRKGFQITGFQKQKNNATKKSSCHIYCKNSGSVFEAALSINVFSHNSNMAMSLSQSRLKYLSDYLMDCYEVFYKPLWWMNPADLVIL